MEEAPPTAAACDGAWLVLRALDVAWVMDGGRDDDAAARVAAYANAFLVGPLNLHLVAPAPAGAPPRREPLVDPREVAHHYRYHYDAALAPRATPDDARVAARARVRRPPVT